MGTGERKVVCRNRKEKNMTRKTTPVPAPAPVGPEGAMFGFPLAMAYVPVQRFRGTADPFEGLRQGTVFNELVKPLECGLRRRALR